MVKCCWVYGCKEKYIKGGILSFHHFPKDPVRRKLWEIKLGRKNFKVTDNSSICSKHFTPDSFDTTKSGNTWLKSDAVPTIFDFSQQIRTSERKELKNSEGRKHFLGDFTDEDMKCPDKALHFFQIAKDITRGKAKSIKILKMACSRYENQISTLTEKLRRANKRLGRSQKKVKSEATSVNHDVSANLELELTTPDSITEPEMTIKEEPMWEQDEGESSGYQDVFPSLSSTDPAPRPGVSATVTPAVVSVKSLVKPDPSGEILGMPVGELPTHLGPPQSSQSVPEDNAGATNGVSEKNRSEPNSSEATGEETKVVVPDYRTRDQFDVYGEYIASKLRRLDWRTCAHVQKAFGDIIFQAEMGKFTVPE